MGYGFQYFMGILLWNSLFFLLFNKGPICLLIAMFIGSSFYLRHVDKWSKDCKSCCCSGSCSYSYWAVFLLAVPSVAYYYLKQLSI